MIEKVETGRPNVYMVFPSKNESLDKRYLAMTLKMDYEDLNMQYELEKEELLDSKNSNIIDLAVPRMKKFEEVREKQQKLILSKENLPVKKESRGKLISIDNYLRNEESLYREEEREKSLIFIPNQNFGEDKLIDKDKQQYINARKLLDSIFSDFN